MKVKKFMKGLLAAALAVTMAVTPVSNVKAAEVTVTSGPSTYTFSDDPAAAFVVSNWYFNDPITLFFLREGTFVYSQLGSSLWQADKLINDGPELGVETRIWRFPYDSTESYDYASDVSEENQENINISHGMFGDGVYRDSGIAYTNEIDWIADDGWVHYKTVSVGDNLPVVVVREIYHADVPEPDAIYVTLIKSDDEIALAKEALAYTGATVEQIPVADALASNNANVQTNTADTQASNNANVQTNTVDTEATETQIIESQAQVTNTTSVSQDTYTVEAGDNLCKIAKKVYGDAKAWKDIYDANSNIIKGNYILHKGQVLVIPAR